MKLLTIQFEVPNEHLAALPRPEQHLAALANNGVRHKLLAVEELPARFGVRNLEAPDHEPAWFEDEQTRWRQARVMLDRGFPVQFVNRGMEAEPS